MVLAVASPGEEDSTQRARALAIGEWSHFTAAEQVAFRFARKQAHSPWSITAEDRQELVDHFGPERALDIIWCLCRCHYMTRIADALKLPLERENVFEGVYQRSTGSAKP